MLLHYKRGVGEYAILLSLRTFRHIWDAGCGTALSRINHAEC